MASTIIYYTSVYDCVKINIMYILVIYVGS